MASMDSPIDKILQYASQTSTTPIDPPGRAVNHPHIEARIDKTLKQLQSRIKDQEKVLAERQNSLSRTSATRGRAADPRVAVQQLYALTSSYEQETLSEPVLCDPDSALPPLLAARHAQDTISQLKTSIKATLGILSGSEQNAQRSKSHLEESTAIQSALRARIDNLKQSQRTRSQRSAAESVKDRIHARQASMKRYDQETERLRQLLDTFIERHLAPMLAAEELGGPVVGDLMDIDDDVLGAGFSQQGKPRPTGSGRKLDSDARQRRIDEIWGPTNEPEDQGSRNEREAAAEELQNLIDQMLEALAGLGTIPPYVELDRDSAAARFLVRAKVAQFHPKDANKLRLIDFGRQLDD